MCQIRSRTFGLSTLFRLGLGVSIYDIYFADYGQPIAHKITAYYTEPGSFPHDRVEIIRTLDKPRHFTKVSFVPLYPHYTIHIPLFHRIYLAPGSFDFLLAARCRFGLHSAHRSNT